MARVEPERIYEYDTPGDKLPVVAALMLRNSDVLTDRVLWELEHSEWVRVRSEQPRARARCHGHWLGYRSSRARQLLTGAATVAGRRHPVCVTGCGFVAWVCVVTGIDHLVGVS